MVDGIEGLCLHQQLRGVSDRSRDTLVNETLRVNDSARCDVGKYKSPIFIEQAVGGSYENQQQVESPSARSTGKVPESNLILRQIEKGKS